jgi:hypothetical protein
MNIENYLRQLVDDIGELLDQEPPGRTGHSWDMPETEDTVGPDQVMVDQGIAITDYSQITQDHLPRPELMDEGQRAVVSCSLLSLLNHCWVYPEFPDEIPDAEKYPFLREHWDRFRIPCIPVGIHYDFCDYDPEHCPFPGKCTDCGSPGDAMESLDCDEPEEAFHSNYLERRKEQIRNFYRNMPGNKYISGIHNYCDRWCERCSLAGFCSVNALDQLQGELKEGMDDESLLLLDVKANFEATMEMIQEWMNKAGIDPASLPSEEKANTDPELSPEPGAIMHLAEEYAREVHQWLKEKKGNAGILSWEHTEAVNVITWYHTIIAAKLYRALLGREFDFEENPVQNDSNGSAKVALYSIRKSITAWSWMIHHRQHEDSSLRLAAMLSELLKRTNEQFPDADKFIRPGFDQPEEEWECE